MENFEEIIVKLRTTLLQSREIVNSLLKELNNEQIPSMSLYEKLLEQLKEASDSEEFIIHYLSKHSEEEKTVSKQSIKGYVELYKNIQANEKKAEISNLQNKLEKFIKVISTDDGYDRHIQPYREKASIKIEKLHQIQDKQELPMFKTDILGFITFVEILSNDSVSSEDPQYDIISEHFSAQVYRGLTLKKYKLSELPIDRLDTPRTSVKVVIRKPQKAQSTKNGESLEELVQILIMKDMKITIDNLRKHLEIIDADPGCILTCATWLLYFTAKDMTSLIFYVNKNKFSEQEIDIALHSLTDRGYLASFQIVADNQIWYTITNNAKNMFLNKSMKMEISRYSKIQPAMLSFFRNLSSLKIKELLSIAERNKSFLQALSYYNDQADKKPLYLIINSLQCNVNCYYVPKIGLVILSSEMLLNDDHTNSDNTIIHFLQGHPELSLLLTDVDDTRETEQKMQVFLPNRIWYSLNEHYKTISDFKEGHIENTISISSAIEIIHNSSEPDVSILNKEETITSESITEIANLIIREGFDRTIINKLIGRLIEQKEPSAQGSPDRIIQALVLLNALSSGKSRDNFIILSRQIQLATGIFFDDLTYDSDTINNLFAYNNGKEYLFLVPTLIRAMFSPDREYDYPLYERGKQILEHDDKYPSEIKQILNTLLDLKKTKRGFSPDMLIKFSDNTIYQRNEDEYSKRARALKTGPNIRARLRGIPRFKELCFGVDSEIYLCMEYIEKKETDERNFIQATLSVLDNENKINDFIDRNWRDATQNEKTKSLKLEYSARGQTCENIHKQLILMEEWLAFTNQETQQLDAILEKTRNVLIRELLGSIENIRQEESWNDTALIIEVLTDIKSSLEKGILPDKRYSLAEFLHSNWVDIDENYKPCFSPIFESLSGMEPWRCVLNHIVEPYQSLESVLKRIDNQNDPYYFDNIGHGLLIEQLLDGNSISTLNSKWDENLERIKMTALSDEEEFKSTLELAFAYGRIKEHEKEILLEKEKLLIQYFEQYKNFGRYRYSLEILRKELKYHSDNIGNELRNRFQECLTNLSAEESKCELAEKTERLLDNENYAVAEDYINRINSGERNLPNEDYLDKNDHFSDFLNKCGNYYDQCFRSRGTEFRTWAPNKIPQNQIWTVRQRESANKILINWPKRKNMSKDTELKILFEEIGFTINDKGISRKIIKENKYDIFEINFRCVELNQPDYPHPIASYGTKIKEKTNIVCLFGTHSVNEVIAIINTELHLGSGTIVLYDSALNLSDRRKLAESFHKSSELNGFLFIDQVLVFYLATLDKSERLSALLKCTLPYTYYQPFSKSAGSIPDEMFFGRKAELKEILSFTGANLVYGGRQLGKTALLERAKSIAHKPGDKEYAIYINAWKKDIQKTIVSIQQELKNIGFPFQSISSMDELCNKLMQLFKNKNINKLLLLIDEADSFLDDAKNTGFNVISPLINLEHNTNNEFKFVFAGLHNVARSKIAIEKNGIFPQMPKPLCIEPLSPSDARNLLKRPLSYLGFNMNDLQHLELILANTNHYPGILHFFGHSLVETVSEKYNEYYHNESPPYSLSDEILKDIFSSKQLNKEIQDRINLTLSLDPHYKILANLIAYLYYIDENRDNDNSIGYTPEQIFTIAKDYDVSEIMSSSINDINILLSEMAQMGILWEHPNHSSYRLRRNNFLDVIGKQGQVENFIIERGWIEKNG
jgi:hypothetical protein